MQNFPLKFVMVGDLKVGKSQLSKRFVKGTFGTDYVSTVGMEYSTKVMPFQKCNLNAQIWDLAGQDRSVKMSAHYYKDAVGAVLVYDVTNRASFDNIKNVWLKQLKEFGHPNISIVLVGNKHDLVSAAGSEGARAVTTQEGIALAKECDMIGFVETTAATAATSAEGPGSGVEGAFRRLVYHVGGMLPPVKVHLDQLCLPTGWMLAPPPAAVPVAAPTPTAPGAAATSSGGNGSPPRVVTPNSQSLRSTSPLPSSTPVSSSPSSGKNNAANSSSSSSASTPQSYLNYWTGEVQASLPTEPATTKLQYTSPARPGSSSNNVSKRGSSVSTNSANTAQTSSSSSSSSSGGDGGAHGGNMEMGGRGSDGVPVKSTKSCCVIS